MNLSRYTVGRWRYPTAWLAVVLERLYFAYEQLDLALVLGDVIVLGLTFLVAGAKVLKQVFTLVLSGAHVKMTLLCINYISAHVCAGKHEIKSAPGHPTCHAWHHRAAAAS